MLPCPAQAKNLGKLTYFSNADKVDLTAFFVKSISKLIASADGLQRSFFNASTSSSHPLKIPLKVNFELSWKFREMKNYLSIHFHEVFQLLNPVLNTCCNSFLEIRPQRFHHFMIVCHSNWKLLKVDFMFSQIFQFYFWSLFVSVRKISGRVKEHKTS